MLLQAMTALNDTDDMEVKVSEHTSAENIKTITGTITALNYNWHNCEITMIAPIKVDESDILEMQNIKNLSIIIQMQAEYDITNDGETVETFMGEAMLPGNPIPFQLEMKRINVGNAPSSEFFSFSNHSYSMTITNAQYIKTQHSHPQYPFREEIKAIYTGYGSVLDQLLGFEESDSDTPVQMTLWRDLPVNSHDTIPNLTQELEQCNESSDSEIKDGIEPIT